MPFHKTYPAEKKPPKDPKRKHLPPENTPSQPASDWDAFIQRIEDGIDKAESNIIRRQNHL